MLHTLFCCLCKYAFICLFVCLLHTTIASAYLHLQAQASGSVSISTAAAIAGAAQGLGKAALLIEGVEGLRNLSLTDKDLDPYYQRAVSSTGHLSVMVQQGVAPPLIQLVTTMNQPRGPPPAAAAGGGGGGGGAEGES